MNLETLIDRLINQLPEMAVTIAVIWTRLHYIEKKLNAVIKGKFRCEDHEKIFEQTLLNMK